MYYTNTVIAHRHARDIYEILNLVDNIHIFSYFHMLRKVLYQTIYAIYFLENVAEKMRKNS